jgi:hypothetical protein
VAQGKYIEEVQATAQNSSFGFTVINMALSAEPDPTGPAARPGVLANVHAQRMILWNYQGSMLQEGFTAGGQPVFNATLGTVTSPTGKKIAEAYGAAYPARTRWRSPLIGKDWPAPPLTCQNAQPVASTPNWRAVLSKALSCQLFTLDGYQQVDGVDALKLTMKPVPDEPVRQTLWVDPSTYLPLRATTTFLRPWGNNSVRVENFKWLPPTSANLAALHAAIGQASIPAGFRMLPSTDLPTVGFGAPNNP